MAQFKGLCERQMCFRSSLQKSSVTVLWQSIEGCVCADRPGASAPAAAAGVPPKPRRRTGNEVDELQHPLLGDQPTLQLLPPRDAVGARTCLDLSHLL